MMTMGHKPSMSNSIFFAQTKPNQTKLKVTNNPRFAKFCQVRESSPCPHHIRLGSIQQIVDKPLSKIILLFYLKFSNGSGFKYNKIPTGYNIPCKLIPISLSDLSLLSVPLFTLTFLLTHQVCSLHKLCTCFSFSVIFFLWIFPKYSGLDSNVPSSDKT